MAAAQPSVNKFTPNIDQFEKDAAAALVKQPNATFGLFIQDLDTGARLEHNADRRLAGGSLVNVDMAAELMAISNAQNSDATKVRSVVSGMLRTEDPTSTQLAFTHIGGADGLGNAATRFGTTSTVAGRDGSWVGNKTTARDRVKLLRVLIDKNTALNPVDQKFIVDSLAASHNEPGWGVRRIGLAASKNATMSDQWVTNTFGLVTTSDNRRLVVCILSAGWNNQADGRVSVDALLRAALTNLGAPAD